MSLSEDSWSRVSLPATPSTGRGFAVLVAICRGSAPSAARGHSRGDGRGEERKRRTAFNIEFPVGRDLRFDPCPTRRPPLGTRSALPSPAASTLVD